MMRRLGTLSLFLFCLIGRSAFAISIDRLVMTADPLIDSGCTTPVAKTSFSPNDDRAYVWINVVNAVVGDVTEFRWFDPNNSSHLTAQYTFTFAGTGCVWAWVEIQGQPAASLPGQWRVDVYLNGSLASTGNFAITGGLPPPPQSVAGAAYLELSVNDQLLVPWTHMDLGYRIKSFQPGRHVDLYVALLLGGGTGEQCISPDRVFASVQPFVSDLALENTQGTISAGHLPGRVLPVRMTVYGVLVAHGVSPADPNNWISNLAALDLLMGTLSSRQHEVLAERGNPKAYVIQFFYDTEQRIETWRYDGGGVGQVFQFINGRPVTRGGGENDDLERARAHAATPATFFGPGRFGPGTTPAEIRALLGDPDRVLPGSPGTQAWVFKDNGITVTVENGVIRQIVAH